MATGERNDPFRAFNFRVEIGTVEIACSECSGLSTDGDSVDYREGSDFVNTVRKLTGLRKYSNITLKRGYTSKARELWDWYNNIVNGVQDRRDGSIILLDETHKDVMEWKFINGWINKIEGSGMNATANEVAIETVEIIHEGLTFEIR